MQQRQYRESSQKPMYLVLFSGLISYPTGYSSKGVSYANSGLLARLPRRKVIAHIFQADCPPKHGWGSNGTSLINSCKLSYFLDTFTLSFWWGS